MNMKFDQLEESGWVKLSGLTAENYESIASNLGTIIHRADVTVKPNSKALTTSDRELGVHTDHHSARIAGLFCVAQASEGGITYLIDGRRILSQLDDDTTDVLRTVKLREHKVFPDDPEEWPLLTGPAVKPSIYYSFWLVKEDLSIEQRMAVKKFHHAVMASERISVRLEPGEALFFYNDWILHGRTKIEGDKNRLLKRIWISCYP